MEINDLAGWTKLQVQIKPVAPALLSEADESHSSVLQ